jgi:hypothetical protein
VAAMSDFELRLELSRLSARLLDTAQLFERGACTPEEVAMTLRDLAADVDRLRPPLPADQSGAQPSTRKDLVRLGAVL